MSYSIVVIDMQNIFLKNVLKIDSDIIQKCKRELIKAINDNAQIIFLEFRRHGPTTKELTSLLKEYKYEKYISVSKEFDDGSKDLLNVILKNNLPHNIKVCGVNTDCCVYDTVSGYLHAMTNHKNEFKDSNEFNVKVIIDACASSWYHERGVKYMRDLTDDFKQLSII